MEALATGVGMIIACAFILFGVVLPVLAVGIIAIKWTYKAAVYAFAFTIGAALCVLGDTLDVLRSVLK